MLVAPQRLRRWLSNFSERHGEPVFEVGAGALRGRAADGSTFTARLPFTQDYASSADVEAFLSAVRAAVPERWGILLVRKGGFAIARVEGGRFAESKVGQRHVQGRTKAGGQSQQRFARRRENQARDAYRAAADHAVRILEPLGRDGRIVAGGDHVAVAEVLAEQRLRCLCVVGPHLPVPDPRRAVLEQAAVDACSVMVDVVNAD